jgi:hypothetical protein
MFQCLGNDRSLSEFFVNIVDVQPKHDPFEVFKVEPVAKLVEQLMGFVIDQPFLWDAVEGLMHRALE